MRRWTWRPSASFGGEAADGSFEFALLLGIPLVGAAVSVRVGAARRSLLWALCWSLAWAAAGGLSVQRVFVEGPLDAASGWLYLDALSGYHLAVISLVFALCSVSAYHYFGREVDSGKLAPRIARRFGLLWAGACFSLTLVLASNNLATMWVGVELTTLTTAFLIRLHVTRPSLEATWKYLVVCSVGVAFAFLGVVFMAAAARGVLPSDEQSTMWTRLAAAAGQLDPGLVKAGFLFVLVGFGTKAGLAPMHTWLPDAHSQAPGPVSALFSGALLNSALYCIMRYVPLAEGATGGVGWARSLLVAFGLLSLLLAAAFIVFQRDVKRLLAYSSVEHIGLITLGIGLGPAGALAALFHVFNHSATKTSAFLAAGRLSQATGTSEILAMRGALRAQPFWGGLLVASLFSLVGAAPFAVFVSEYMLVAAAAGSGAWGVAALLLGGLAVAFAGGAAQAVALGWGPPPAGAPPPVRAPPFEAAAALLPLALVLAVGLVVPAVLVGALHQAAAVLGGAG